MYRSDYKCRKWKREISIRELINKINYITSRNVKINVEKKRLRQKKVK